MLNKVAFVIKNNTTGKTTKGKAAYLHCLSCSTQSYFGPESTAFFKTTTAFAYIQINV